MDFKTDTKTILGSKQRRAHSRNKEKNNSSSSRSYSEVHEAVFILLAYARRLLKTLERYLLPEALKPNTPDH